MKYILLLILSFNTYAEVCNSILDVSPELDPIVKELTIKDCFTKSSLKKICRCNKENEKYIFMIYVFLSTLYNTQIIAQENAPPNWTWATNIEGFESGVTNNNYNIHTDKDGNSYVIDQVEGHLKIAYYHANGTQLWNRDGSSGNGGVTPTDITVDAEGYYYISGYFTLNSVTFVSYTLSENSGKAQDFVVKYDLNGTVLWAKKAV